MSAEARQAAAEQALQAYVARVVSEAPPLNAEQRTRIATLLGGVSK